MSLIRSGSAQKAEPDFFVGICKVFPPVKVGVSVVDNHSTGKRETMTQPKKNTIPTILTWLTIAASVCAIGIHFVSCSRDISSIVQNQQTVQDLQEQEINQLIDAQSLMPPIVTEGETGTSLDILKGKKIGLGDSILIYDRPIVLPSAVDDERISKNQGGFILLHNGNEIAGSLEIGANAIPEDTTVQITSYSLTVIGLDVREYQFSPDGLQFSQKADLKLSGSLFKKSDGSPAEEILWLYLNPAINRWELQGIIKKDQDGYFHIELSHFSTYRAATKNGAGVSQGGQVKPNIN